MSNIIKDGVIALKVVNCMCWHYLLLTKTYINPVKLVHAVCCNSKASADNMTIFGKPGKTNQIEIQSWRRRLVGSKVFTDSL